MSEPSRPRRRLALTLPPGLTAGSTPDGERQGETGRSAPATPKQTDGGAARAAAPPSRTPPAGASLARPRKRLRLTMPTLGPSVSGESASPADAVAGAAPAPAAPATASAGPTGRPHRRLALTAPTDGRRQMDATGAAVGPAVETVMGTYRLPKVLVEALEEEWWRRQAAGEAWSRSEIVAASVANGLADPARLDEALRHLHERKIS